MPGPSYRSFNNSLVPHKSPPGVAEPEPNSLLRFASELSEDDEDVQTPKEDEISVALDDNTMDPLMPDPDKY
jgi:hypothetical protein